jgi:hypothetical protein
MLDPLNEELSNTLSIRRCQSDYALDGRIFSVLKTIQNYFVRWVSGGKVQSVWHRRRVYDRISR